MATAASRRTAWWARVTWPPWDWPAPCWAATICASNGTAARPMRPAAPPRTLFPSATGTISRRPSMNSLKALLLTGLAALLLAGCASTRSVVGTETLDPQARWALLPVVNNTETPQAGLSAESIVEHHLMTRGLTRLQRYPAALTRDSLFEPTERKLSEDALKWAREQGVRYAVTGSVEEWRYKVGLDGEPVAAVT